MCKRLFHSLREALARDLIVTPVMLGTVWILKAANRGQQTGNKSASDRKGKEEVERYRWQQGPLLTPLPC